MVSQRGIEFLGRNLQPLLHAEIAGAGFACAGAFRPGGGAARQALSRRTCTLE